MLTMAKTTSPTYRCFQVDISTLAQEEAHHVQLAEMAGYMKRCVAGLQSKKASYVRHKDIIYCEVKLI
jgi:hypothetical protein